MDSPRIELRIEQKLFFSHLVIQDGVSGWGVVLKLVIGEGHPGVVIVGAAHHKLAGVLVQRKLVEPHRTHERYVSGLDKV